MSSWKGQSRGTPLGYRIFFFTLRVFGIRAAYALLRFVAFYYFLFAWNVVRIQRHYFIKVHHYSAFKSWWMVYRNLVQFGQTLIDKTVVMSGEMKAPFDVRFTGDEHIQNALDEGEGVLLISAHIGNWEAAGQMLNKFNTTINLVMMDAERERLKSVLSAMQTKRKLNIIAIGNDLSHLVAIRQALLRNEIVALHGDRFVEGQRTMPVPFFGSKAFFPLGPFMLASKLKVRALFVFCMKESDLQYHFYAYDSGEKGEKSEILLQRFVSLLGRKLKSYPAQWYNYYDFWGFKSKTDDGDNSGR